MLEGDEIILDMERLTDETENIATSVHNKMGLGTRSL
jgi:hypothetical protein